MFFGEFDGIDRDIIKYSVSGMSKKPAVTPSTTGHKMGAPFSYRLICL